MAATTPDDLNKNSYPSLHNGTLLAANHIAPLILSLFPRTGSVVDISCSCPRNDALFNRLIPHGHDQTVPEMRPTARDVIAYAALPQV